MIRPEIRRRWIVCLTGLLVLALLIGGASLVSAASEAGPDASVHDGGGQDDAGEHGGVDSGKVKDLIYRAMNFIALFLVLFLVLRKPAGQFFSNRRDNIAQTLADFEQKKSEAEARFRELETKLNALDQERQQIIAEYIKDGEEEKAKIIANAHDLAERIQKQAEVSIAHEIQMAKADLMRDIAEMSASMAEELIRNNIDDQDQQRLVKEYLTKVVQH